MNTALPKLPVLDMVWPAILLAFLFYAVLLYDARRTGSPAAGDDQLGIKTVAATLVVVGTWVFADGLRGFLLVMLTFDDFWDKLKAALPSLLVGALVVMGAGLVLLSRTNAASYPKAKRLAAGVVALYWGITLVPALVGLFVLWVLAGAAGLLTLLGLLTIGIFVLPPSIDALAQRLDEEITRAPADRDEATQAVGRRGGRHVGRHRLTQRPAHDFGFAGSVGDQYDAVRLQQRANPDRHRLGRHAGAIEIARRLVDRFLREIDHPGARISVRTRFVVGDMAVVADTQHRQREIAGVANRRVVAFRGSFRIGVVHRQCMDIRHGDAGGLDQGTFEPSGQGIWIVRSDAQIFVQTEELESGQIERTGLGSRDQIFEHPYRRAARRQ